MYINYTQRARRNVTQEIEEVSEKWSKVFGSKGVFLLERGENVDLLREVEGEEGSFGRKGVEVEGG